MNATRMLTSVCKWTARIFGLALILMIVVFAIGEGVPNIFTQPAEVQIEFLALSLTLLGILAGWRWQIPGGVASLVGCGLFVGTEVLSHARVAGFILAWGIPGMFLVVGGLLNNCMKTR